MLEVLPEQHFTQPPPRFSEASLVKTLEELGIGRPSTYASIISTIQDRGYVRLEDKRFYPEDVGMVVTDKLIEHFPDVVDVNFTAHMEDELDEIAEGGIGVDAGAPRVQRAVPAGAREGRALVRAVRGGARRALPALSEGGTRAGQARRSSSAGSASSSAARTIRSAATSATWTAASVPSPCCSTRPAPSAGVHKLQERVGRFGPFVGCSGYPECRYIRKDPPVSTGVTCPECHQGTLVENGRTASARRSTAATGTPSARSR